MNQELQKSVSRIRWRAVSYLKLKGPTILTAAGIVGVVVTAVEAGKATPKALMLLDEAQENKQERDGEDLTKLEVVKVVLPVFVPTIIAGTSSIACIAGANILNQRKQAALTSAYYLTKSAFDNYRNKTIELKGEEVDEEIQKAIINDRLANTTVTYEHPEMLFYDSVSGECFCSTEKKVLEAFYHFNRNFKLRGYVTYNELCDFLEISRQDYGDALGWSDYMGEITYGYVHIDYHLKRDVFDNGYEYFVIEYPFPPHEDFMGDPE